MVILVLLKLRTGLSIKVLQYQQEERGPGWTPAILRVGISSLISSSTCWRECNITALLSEDYRHRPSVKIREFIIFCIYYVLACVLCDRATVKKSPSFKTRDRSILHLRAITTIKNRMQKAEVRLSEAFHPSIRSNNFYSLLSWRLKNEGTFFFSTRQFIPVHRSAVQCRNKKKKSEPCEVRRASNWPRKHRSTNNNSRASAALVYRLCRWASFTISVRSVFRFS